MTGCAGSGTRAVLFPHLGETGSSLVHVLLVIGVSLLVPALLDRERTFHRALILTVAALLALRYFWWRATETVAPFGLTMDWAASWSLLLLEGLSLLGTLSSFLILSRTRDRSEEATANLSWWGEGRPPRVAILIATYNEDQDVLERTIIGSKELRHPNKTIHVLDDGKRDWLRDFCAAQNVDYIRRPDNRDAKAGNINHALEVLAADPPDFVAVLDADFVPHRGFISRSLALFHDPKVGLVQTPQHFFNADPIQHNLNLSRSYPDEQRFFFDTLQASRDAWGIAFCCGTSSVVRWQALQELGGFPTDSVTEDFMLTLTLQAGGWRTAYLNEPVTEGLAPEGLKEYITQRSRWCLGMMQIARSRVGPLSDAPLRLRDRWSVIDAGLYWLTAFPFRLAAVAFPLLYWFFNITVVNARVPDVISYFGAYYLWTVAVLNFLSRNNVVPIINDVSQLVGALPITRAAIVGLLKPKGHPFKVTAKGGDRSRITVQWRLMAPFAILLGLTLLGLVIGIFSDEFAFYDAGEGKAVVLFWTIYNLFVLILTVTLCVELPRHEKHIADAPERAVFEADGTHHVWLVGLTATSVRIRGYTPNIGSKGVLRLGDVGPVTALALAPTLDGARLQLLPTAEQAEALHVKFYTDDKAPGVLGAQLDSLFRDIARRFAFTSGR